MKSITKLNSKNFRRSLKNNLKKGLCAGICGVLLTSLVGCNMQGQMSSVDLMEDIGENSDAPQTDLSDLEYRFEDNGALALTDFGVELLKKSFANGKNTLISPLSVISALGMTMNGAKGETLKEMLEVFGIPMESLNAYLQEYRTSLPEGEKYQLHLANAIWFKDMEEFQVNGEFLKTNQNFYEAGVYKAAFDDSTKEDINQWVEEHTHGMIQNILDEMDEAAVMFLVNALAFEAEWQDIYEENQVRDGKFTTEDGKVRDVELMYSEEAYFLRDEDANGFLKYYKDKSYAFAALLPNEGVKVSEYLESLDGEKLNGMLKNAEQQPVNAGIPKFKTEYSVELKEVLEAMGVTEAFDAVKADLSGLGSSTAGNLYIECVIHKTFMEMDAKGTKAGAATVVQVNCESAVMYEKEPARIILDRPFVYMIIDCKENVPVFIGTMMDVAQ